MCRSLVRRHTQTYAPLPLPVAVTVCIGYGFWCHLRSVARSHVHKSGDTNIKFTWIHRLASMVCGCTKRCGLLGPYRCVRLMRICAKNRTLQLEIINERWYIATNNELNVIADRRNCQRNSIKHAIRHAFLRCDILGNIDAQPFIDRHINSISIETICSYTENNIARQLCRLFKQVDAKIECSISGRRFKPIEYK